MKDKELKTVIRWIMALMVIGVLFIPAFAVYEIEARTETNILSVQGLYTNGTGFTTIEPIDKTHVGLMYSGETITLSQPNNDSYLLSQIGWGVEDIAYLNSVNYIGNGTYAVTPNYTVHTEPPTILNYQIGIPINLTTHDLAEYDFIRLYSNSQHGQAYLIYRTVFGGTIGWACYFDVLETNVFIIPITLAKRQSLLSSPNENVYLFYDFVNPADVTWNFKIEGYVLDSIHQFTWDDNQLYLVSLLIVAGILTPCAIFSSKLIDIKFDKGKPGGK